MARAEFVAIMNRDVPCAVCAKPLEGGWAVLGDTSRCMVCAGLEGLVLLPSGDAALTRRAVKNSSRSVVVNKWLRSRRVWARQGVLVEEAALAKARQECSGDADARAAQRRRGAARRRVTEQSYEQRFAARVRELYPKLPAGEEAAIARRACAVSSGRVGRSAAAKDLDEAAIRAAVVAHARHAHTAYDDLLRQGCDRGAARDAVRIAVVAAIAAWSSRLPS